jgi:hypothetical protein
MNGVSYAVRAESYKEENWKKSSERVEWESAKRRLRRRS